MLSPPTGFQGSHGQEKKEQGDADKIHDVRRVYHAPCEIVKMSTDTDLSDDLASQSANWSNARATAPPKPGRPPATACAWHRRQQYQITVK